MNQKTTKCTRICIKKYRQKDIDFLLFSDKKNYVKQLLS